MNISIIIPIYNVKKYLAKCLDSIIKTIIDNKIEIILVDDGSTDDSSKIADDYNDKYDFIKCFHKKNGGLSDARNYGLRKSNGKYVIFIDSDDMVDSNKFKSLLKKIEKSDEEIILWDAEIIDENDKKVSLSCSDYYLHNGLKNNSVYSGNEVIVYQIDDHNDFVTTVWLGAYKRDFLIDNNMFFEKGLIHEDELWSIKVLATASKIKYLNDKIYLYRLRDDSIMNKKDKNYLKNLNDIIYIYNSLFSYLNWKIEDKIFLKKIVGNISKRYLHALAKFEIFKYKNLIKKINIKQINNNSTRIIDKIRCLVLECSPKLYCKLSSIF